MKNRFAIIDKNTYDPRLKDYIAEIVLLKSDVFDLSLKEENPVKAINIKLLSGKEKGTVIMTNPSNIDFSYPIKKIPILKRFYYKYLI